MKKLIPFTLCIILFSCGTLNVEKIIKSEISYFDVSGKVEKIIEKKFSIDEGTSRPSWETHIEYDSKNRVVALREHRVYKDIETGKYELMKPSVSLYIYDGNKLKEIQYYTYGSMEDYENDIDPRYVSIIAYDYVNKNKATFEAHRYENKDHRGIIRMAGKNEAERILEYENREPLIYNSIYDKNANLVSNIKTFYQGENKTVDSTQYNYNNGLMTAMTVENVILNYEYEFDNHNNWIKRIGSSNNKIFEIINREIIYRN